MFVYFLPEGDGVLTSKEKKTDPRYHLIGEANSTEELAAMLSDEKFMQEYAGEIAETFKERRSENG